jgi:hypothetical protein
MIGEEHGPHIAESMGNILEYRTADRYDVCADPGGQTRLCSIGVCVSSCSCGTANTWRVNVRLGYRGRVRHG